jgi:hypothetical protein
LCKHNNNETYSHYLYFNAEPREREGDEMGKDSNEINY